MHAQACLVLRWLRHRAEMHTLARAAGVSEATAYRYLHEGLDVIAAHAPDCSRSSPPRTLPGRRS